MPVDIIKFLNFEAACAIKSKFVVSKDAILPIVTPMLLKKSTLSISKGVEKKSIFASSA